MTVSSEVPINSINPINAFNPRTSLTAASFDAIAFGNSDPDMLCKDLQCTEQALNDFLASEQCQKVLQTREKLGEFQAKVRAQYQVRNAICALEEVTRSKNAMAKHLAANHLLALAGIHPEKPPTLFLHHSIQSPPIPSAGAVDAPSAHGAVPCEPKPAVCNSGANVPPQSAHGAEAPSNPRPEKIKNPKWNLKNRISPFLTPLLLAALLLQNLCAQRYTSRPMDTTPTASQAHALHIDGLVKTYGPLHAVRNISLQVPPGEVFGLLGRNGAGKTTTIECAIGLRRPDAGTIHVAGIDVLKNPAQAREKIGVQLQATALQDKITPRQALKLFAAFYENPAPAAELLERFDLTKKADAPFDTLSGGQRQRLALALALVNRPEVIFLDEPTAGLDAEAKRELHRMILDLRSAGRTILLTTHDIEEAARLCDRLAIIDRGEIITTGTPAELVEKVHTHTLITARTQKPLQESALRALPGIIATEYREGAWQLETDSVTATVTAVAKLVEESATELLDLQIHRPTLEDAFLEILRERDKTAAGAKKGAA